MTDFWQQYEVSRLRDEVERLRHRANAPRTPVPMDEATRKHWDEVEKESAKAWGVPVFLGVLVGFVLLCIESLAASILTWLYVGSEKGLTVALADGPTNVGLHWDPLLAGALCLVAGVAWFALFVVPVIGPLAGLTASAVWGVALYSGTGSLGVGLVVFIVSMGARMVMRKSSWRWQSVAEWGLVAALALVALAPFGARLPMPGLGGWQALREVHATQTCDKALRAGRWKDRYRGTTTFYAERRACVSARLRG
jgi:hypothetical protein